MEVSRVSGRVLSGPLESVYVYEAPVRFWHWAMAACIVVLMITGYLIGVPPPSVGGEATFGYWFANIRLTHYIAAMLFAVLFLVRIYWALAGNHHARSIFLPPVWRKEWWDGLVAQVKYYLFLRRESELWIGHNPLAQLAMAVMFGFGVTVAILTGYALYAEQYGWGSAYMNAFGWVNVWLGGSHIVRIVHRLTMWWLLLFSVVHIYMVIREDIMSGETVVGTMVNGIRMFKRPAGHPGR